MAESKSHRVPIFLNASGAAVAIGYNPYKSIAEPLYDHLVRAFPDRVKTTTTDLFPNVCFTNAPTETSVAKAAISSTATTPAAAIELQASTVLDELTRATKSGNTKTVADVTGIPEAVIAGAISSKTGDSTTLQKKQKEFRDAVEKADITDDAKKRITDAVVSVGNCSYGTRTEDAVFERCLAKDPNLRKAGICETLHLPNKVIDGREYYFSVNYIPDGISVDRASRSAVDHRLGECNESRSNVDHRLGECNESRSNVDHRLGECNESSPEDRASRSDVGPYILEIKNRQRKLFYKYSQNHSIAIGSTGAPVIHNIPIRAYEYVQVHVYMMATGIRRTLLVENYRTKTKGDQEFTVEVPYDEVFAAEMLRRIEGFARTVGRVADDPNLLAAVVKAKKLGKFDSVDTLLMEMVTASD